MELQRFNVCLHQCVCSYREPASGESRRITFADISYRQKRLRTFVFHLGRLREHFPKIAALTKASGPKKDADRISIQQMASLCSTVGVKHPP